MKTVFKHNGQLNLEIFDPHLLQQTKNLGEVLAAAANTQSASVESTHFLMALIRIPDGLTKEFFRQKGIASRDLEEGLAGCAARDSRGNSPRRLEPNVLHSSAKNLVAALDGYLETGKIQLIDEGHLLLRVIENLTTVVEENLSYVQLKHSDLIVDLKKKLKQIGEYKIPVPFDNKIINPNAFTPGGQRVLELMKTEANSLGFSKMDPRHLLLALLEYEGGATQVALYQQDVLPKKVQERLMINLRGQARKKPSQLNLNREDLSASVINILEQASRETQTDLSGQVAEVHIFRSFLQSDAFALQHLSDSGVDLRLAREAAPRFKPEDEPAPPDAVGVKSLEQIKSHLEASLVGQQDVIDICLPIIRRMLFKFHQPGKPAGVLIFCGPSGVGKTEMAKAMARAVFGSEDSLIMLEMGQFQTKESMNIFIGAPPGYIGYGEGKLTNGLRDKPLSVVLFDEVEKAHPEVFDALLRFIDEGQVDDPAGPIRDGSNCIIVLTTNIRTDGLEKFIEEDGYKKNKWEIRRKLKEALLNLPIESKSRSRSKDSFQFRSEFLNRVDDIVLFRALDENDLTEIARRHLLEYSTRLKDEKQINLVFSPKLEAAARLIGRFCSTLTEGARATLRVSHTAVLDPVIDFVYSQDCSFPVSLVIHFPQDPEAVEEPHGIVSFLEE
ncbi:MAG: AAA family ATPase [Candidatus Aminicenantes bacterium]|jgi:ATP-dependent Clp protease ATP-binding subunit ClpC